MLKDWKKVDDKEAALARCQHNSEPDKWMLPTAQDWHAYFGPKQKVPDVVEKLSDKWRLLMLTAYEKLQKHHFVDVGFFNFKNRFIWRMIYSLIWK